MKINRNFWLWIEMILLFILCPILLWKFKRYLQEMQAGGSFLVLILPIFATILLFVLIKFLNFNPKELWKTPDFKHHVVQILKVFIPSAIVYTTITYFYLPEYFFQLPKEDPQMWLMIMLAYPIFSVLPQGIIYRVFMFRRYQKLVQNPMLFVVLAGFLFCFAHLLFNNIVALIFTFLGGLLFAWRYDKTQSWLLTSLEHAMYGNLLFTIGIGRFLVVGMN